MTKKLLVVGEQTTGREKEPFTNKAGREFRAAMMAALINPTRAEFVYLETLGGLYDAIDKYKSEFVLLVGSKALQIVQPDLTVGQCHGRIMSLDDKQPPILVCAVFHQEAFVRMPKQFGPLLEKELALFRHVCANREHWHEFIAETCVKCRAPRNKVTLQGVAYCVDHSA